MAPAFAGMTAREAYRLQAWIPAFAGMTSQRGRRDFQSRVIVHGTRVRRAAGTIGPQWRPPVSTR
jgi:hypothetical protein